MENTAGTAPEAEKRKARFGPAFAGYVIGFFALFELERMINVPGMTAVYSCLTILEFFLLDYMAGTVSFRENKWMGIFAGGLVLLAATSLIRGADVLAQTQKHLERGMFVYLLCPAIGLLIPRYGLKNFFRIFIGIWTLFYTVVCVMGIYAIMNGLAVLDASAERGIAIRAGRLFLFYYATISASNMTMTIMMCLIGIMLYQNKAMKLLFIAEILPMFVCLALTNGRAGYVVTGLGIGGALLCMLHPFFRRKIRRKWVRYACYILLIAMAAGISILANYQILSGYNRYAAQKNKKSLLISSAMAEEKAQEDQAKKTEETEEKETPTPKPKKKTTQKSTTTKKTTATPKPAATKKPATKKTTTKGKKAREREISNINTLASRAAAWEAVFEAIGDSPEILFVGTSAPLWQECFEKYSVRPGYFYHVHNMPLQILLETGIAGVGLAAAFLILLIRRSIRLIQNHSLQLWERMIFLPAAAGLMIETVECMMMLSWNTQVQVIVMVFSGMTLVLGAPEEKKAHKFFKILRKNKENEINS